MREILFRGKRTDNGEWVEGQYIAAHHHWHNRGIHKDWIISAACSNGGWFSIHGRYPVVTDTVGQFTGLTDKNGTKIFEGDILSTKNGTFSNTGMGYILLYRGMWTSFYGQDALGRDCFDELHTVCSAREVIGNIHDNPELLGGELNGCEQQAEGREV